jgi:hypothetical protein
MEVVGESNYQQALVEICGPHSRYGHDQEQAALVELEPSNPHDPDAVVVKMGAWSAIYLGNRPSVWDCKCAKKA